MTAAALGKLCPGCSGVTGEGGESPAQQAEGTGGDRVFRDTAELRTTQVLCCEGGKLQDDSHRSSGWRLPQEGSLETSGSLEVLPRLHDPATVLLYTKLTKEFKKQHGLIQVL